MFLHFTLAEQKEIIARVEAKLQIVTALQVHIAEREELTKQLFQCIIKESFQDNVRY